MNYDIKQEDSQILQTIYVIALYQYRSWKILNFLMKLIVFQEVIFANLHVLPKCRFQLSGSTSVKQRVVEWRTATFCGKAQKIHRTDGINRGHYPQGGCE